MNRFEQEYYANIGNIARTLDRIANALENNNKEDKIYYKTRKDMFMDNPCTKEEYEASKQEAHNVKHAFTGMDGKQIDNIPGFEGTLDALDNLYQPSSTRKAILEQQALNRKIAEKEGKYAYDNDLNEYKYVSKVGKIKNDSDFEVRQIAKRYEDDLLANGKTKKDCILDYITENFGPEGARYTDIIKFAYYLGAHNAPKYTSENRGYYAMAFNTRFGGHLITGGKDQLVKGINEDGKERYFALSFVDNVTDYYKRLDQ